MELTRAVKFEYFLVKSVTFENRNRNVNVMNLAKLFKKISGSDLKETHIDNADIGKIRIYSCEYDKVNRIWLLQVIKLREKNLPGIVNDEDDSYRPITLTDEEYVGEFISLIFDPQKCILYSSRNRYSVNPTALGKYFTLLYEKVFSILKLIYLEVCQEEIDYKKTLQGTTIKNIHVSVVRPTNYADTYKGYLSAAILGLGSHYDSKNIKLSISKGRGRGGFDYEEVDLITKR